MKKMILSAATALAALSLDTWGAATVQLKGTIFYDHYGGLPPTDPSFRSISVLVLGGPSAARLAPVVDSQGKAIIMRLGSDAQFDGSVGIVPEVADNNVATFQVLARTDFLAWSDYAPVEFQSVLWTQTTGSWNPAAVPSQPMVGPPLDLPGRNIYRGSVGDITIVPSTITSPLDYWTVRASGTDRSLSSIVCGNTTFVAVGKSGTVLTSPGGTNWTKVASGTTNDLSGIAYGNQTFVATGNCGTILTSTDGTNWTRVSSGTTDDVEGMAYGNSTFVAVVELVNITYGNNEFVATGVGPGSLPPLLISSDASRWTKQWLAGPGLESIFTSRDGNEWRLGCTDYDPWALQMGCTAAGNGHFVTLGSKYGYVSNDGNTWYKWNTPTVWCRGITFGVGTFVAVGWSGDSRNTSLIMSSKDGIDWTTHAPGTSQGLVAVAYGNDTFVAVGEGGTIVQSAPLSPIVVPPTIGCGLNGSVVELALAGAVGHSYLIQSADDLSGNISWQTLATLTLTNSPATWFDLTATNHAWRYYRALTQPQGEQRPSGRNAVAWPFGRQDCRPEFR